MGRKADGAERNRNRHENENAKRNAVILIMVSPHGSFAFDGRERKLSCCIIPIGGGGAHRATLVPRNSRVALCAAADRPASYCDEIKMSTSSAALIQHNNVSFSALAHGVRYESSRRCAALRNDYCTIHLS